MKSLFSLMALMLLCLSSCSLDEKENLLAPEGHSLNVVNVIDGRVWSRDANSTEGINTMSLQFSSEADLQELLNKFSKMTADERIAFTDGLGFISLEKRLQMADEELDSIGATASSEAEFRIKYSAFKEKYSQIFVFNNQKMDDLSPYIPASNETDDLAFLVGENRSIVIGNSICEVCFSNNLREIDNLIYNKEENSAQTRAANVNGFIIVDGSKKTIFGTKIISKVLTSTVTRKQMQYHFGAQKKMWYGWKRDNDRDLIFTDLGVNLSGHFDRRYFTQANGNFDFTGGYTDLRAGLTREFTGIVYVWTDRALERDERGNIIYIDPAVIEFRRPKLDERKAYTCQINYSVTY